MNKATTLLTLSCAFLAGCQTVTQPPIETVGKVDLPRFMGDWYVIANIPTFIEKGAHNAIESYKLAGDGSIETTFTFGAVSAWRRSGESGWPAGVRKPALWKIDACSPTASAMSLPRALPIR